MTSTTFFFVFIPLLAVILLAINLIFAPHNPDQEKDSVFECGFHSFLGQNRTQFSVSFFIFALLFLLFDLEILLVYPYVVSAYSNDIYGLIIMLLFFIVLTLGFAFELGKNALKIDTRQIFITVYRHFSLTGFFVSLWLLEHYIFIRIFLGIFLYFYSGYSAYSGYPGYYGNSVSLHVEECSKNLIPKYGMPEDVDWAWENSLPNTVRSLKTCAEVNRDTATSVHWRHMCKSHIATINATLWSNKDPVAYNKLGGIFCQIKRLNESHITMLTGRTDYDQIQAELDIGVDKYLEGVENWLENEQLTIAVNRASWDITLTPPWTIWAVENPEYFPELANVDLTNYSQPALSSTPSWPPAPVFNPPSLFNRVTNPASPYYNMPYESNIDASHPIIELGGPSSAPNLAPNAGLITAPSADTEQNSNDELNRPKLDKGKGRAIDSPTDSNNEPPKLDKGKGKAIDWPIDNNQKEAPNANVLTITSDSPILNALVSRTGGNVNTPIQNALANSSSSNENSNSNPILNTIASNRDNKNGSSINVSLNNSPVLGAISNSISGSAIVSASNSPILNSINDGSNRNSFSEGDRFKL